MTCDVTICGEGGDTVTWGDTVMSCYAVSQVLPHAELQVACEYMWHHVMGTPCDIMLH